MTLWHVIWTFLLSMVPVGELRASLPVAMLTYDMHWYYALPIALVGNLLPVPFVLRFLDPLTRSVSKVRLFKRIIDWVFARTRKRGKMVEKYGPIGLAIFVAVPLPGTGAWTGAILAFLLGLDFKKSVLSIGLGVLAAGIIVTSLVLLGRLAV